MKKKELVIAAILAMAIGLSACGSTNNAPAPEAAVETMTINSFDVEITHVPYAKYQIELLKENDYYTDALDEDDSPQFVFIGPAGKSVYRDVTDIQIDDSQNVTINVHEVKADMIGAPEYPITRVKIYPFPASITVLDENGNALSGQ